MLEWPGLDGTWIKSAIRIVRIEVHTEDMVGLRTTNRRMNHLNAEFHQAYSFKLEQKQGKTILTRVRRAEWDAQ
jgi:hypothetical protein